jgi:hypothetical protein
MPTGEYTLGTEYPKYGGIDIFGAQGLGNAAVDFAMLSTGEHCTFKKGLVYNLEASGVIRNGGGFSGAHSDIAHPEVAPAMWQAILSSI